MYLLERKEATDGCMMITASGIKKTDRVRREEGTRASDQILPCSQAFLLSGEAQPSPIKGSTQPN